MSLTKASLDALRIERGAGSVARKHRWLALLLLAVVILGAAAIWWLTRSKAVEVRTAEAHEAADSSGAETVLNASGYVTARREATISSKISDKVTEVLVEEGMKVAEGDVLARLDDTNVVASLRLAEAQSESARRALAETQIRLDEAKQDLKRQADLIKDNVVAQADYDHAVADASALEARLQQQRTDATVAERTVSVWQRQLDDTVIRAPFAGIVTSKNAQPGEMISPESAGGGFTRTGICTVVDMKSLEIEVDVNEAYINRVESGQPVEATLDAYPDWRIPCKVIAIIPTADRDKSTVKVRVGFDQLDPRILPEMSVKVAFRGENSGPAQSRAVLVPKSAVRQDSGKDIVMIVRDGRVERRAVSVSGTTENEAALTAGVAAGERVVVDGPKDLADGAAVKEINP